MIPSVKKVFQNLIRENGIESRPLISGNLLQQPFLKSYYNKEEYQNAEILHFNAFYKGNNQFVGDSRLDVLETLLDKGLC